MKKSKEVGEEIN